MIDSEMSRVLAALLLVVVTGGSSLAQVGASRATARPNVVIIFTDDHGYADVGQAAAARGIRTPNLDRMAAEGIRLDSFYVAQAVCSASRAALLTGTYPNRIGILGALDHQSRTALHPDEVTIAELFKAQGYATAAVGKWHLGLRPEHLPTRQGFDEYFGLPYSNDMWPHHPLRPGQYPPLPLFRGEQVIETQPDQAQLTTRYTEHAVDFIARHRDRPFFLYLAHSMPHVPLFVSEKHRGRSPGGLYGDVIEEIDWSVGEVLQTLRRLDLDERTLVIFASDNGPWAEYGDHAGSAAPLRGSKGTVFEGGVRVPFIARWPGRIPAGARSSVPVMAIDMLPSLASVIGAAVPSDRIIDGRNAWPVLTSQPGAAPPHDVLYFYWLDALHAVRSGKWKLHLPHPYRDVPEPGRGGKPGSVKEGSIELSLCDLEADPGETTNLAARHPDVVARLQQLAEAARDDLGDALTGRKGRNLRPAAVVNPDAPR